MDHNDSQGPLPVEARRGLTRAKLPNGLRFAVPISWLVPRIEDHPEHGDESDADYFALLEFVRLGRVSDEWDNSRAMKWDWVPRLKELAELAFFFEASASCYETLVTAVDGNKGIDIKRAIDGMKSLTGYGAFVEETEER